MSTPDQRPNAPPAMAGATTYLSSSVLTMAASMLAWPILTRWLTPEQFGLVALAQLVALVFTGLVNLGVSTGIERNFFSCESDPVRLGELVHSGLAFLAAGTIGWGLLGLAVREPLSILITGERTWALFFIAIGVAAGLETMFAVELVTLRNAGCAAQYFRCQVGAGLLENGLSVALVIAGPWQRSVWGLALGQIVGKGVMVVWLWWRLARLFPPRLALAPVRELIGIGWPIMPKTWLGVLESGIDRLFVRWLTNLGQVGIFGLAHSIGYAVFVGITSLEHVYIPQLYRMMFKDRPDTGMTIGSYLTPYCFVSLFIPMAVVLFIEEALVLLVAPAFYGIKAPAALLAVYYGQMVFGKFAGVQLTYRKRVWYAIPLGLVRLALHAGLACLAIPRWGALGAAAALLASGLLSDAVAVAVGQRAYPIRYELRVVGPMLALVYAALGWVLLPKMLPVPYGILLAGKLTLLGAFLAVGVRGAPQIRDALAERMRARRGKAATTTPQVS